MNAESVSSVIVVLVIELFKKKNKTPPDTNMLLSRSQTAAEAKKSRD